MKPIVFIPARSGSKRIKDKNIVKLGNFPLIYYTINLAVKSNLFSNIYCVTDSNKYQKIALKYGAHPFPLRSKKISGSNSPDLHWIRWALSECKKKKLSFESFVILRPTSPFRTVSMLKRGLNIFKKGKCDSVRGVELTTIHPGKIWRLDKDHITPIIKKKLNGIPWHSNQYAALPKFYSQNASLEICKRTNIKKYGQFSGKKISPLITRGLEGFDINHEIDLIYARQFVKKIRF